MTNKLKIGDSVIVKNGIKDPDFNTDLSGWVGRIIEIDSSIILIEWDSITIQQMDYDIITKAEDDGLEWQLMNLETTDVRKTNDRDTKEETVDAIRRITRKLMDDYTEEDDIIDFSFNVNSIKKSITTGQPNSYHSLRSLIAIGYPGRYDQRIKK